MDIYLRDLIDEPIAILCYGPKNARVWSGMAKSTSNTLAKMA